MNILGINGWGDWFHDSSACLFVDNILQAFCEEERFVREKHAPCRSPVNAVNWCLDYTKLTWSDIDYVAVGWDIPAIGLRMPEKLSAGECAKRIVVDLGSPDDFSLGKIIFVNHHVSHAMSGVLIEPLQQSLILVLDGQGENESLSCFRFSSKQLVKLFSLDSRYSLGYFYEAASAFCGLGLTGTGKLMGLSSYAKTSAELFFENGEDCFFQTPIPLSFLQEGSVNSEKDLDDSVLIADHFWAKQFSKRFPSLKRSDYLQKISFEERNKLHNNHDAVEFASIVQESLEKSVISIISKNILPEDRAIIVVGGVGLNCKLNGKILETFPDKRVVVQPLANDAGVSLGAATHVALMKCQIIVNKGDFPYVGPGFTDDEIVNQLQKSGCKFYHLVNPVIEAAKMLEGGLVIGWFQGQAEVGPRALGARSILARPDSIVIRDQINALIKHRECWRPLAPAILRDSVGLHYSRCDSSPYMLFGFYSNDPETRRMFQGTIHVDGTSRVQSVDSHTPKLFHDLILEFQRITGIPGILNTSFNIAEEPIVCSPEDAIKTFSMTGLDALFIGNHIVYKED